MKLPSSTPHRVTLNGNYTWETDLGNITGSVTYVWRAATYYDVFNRYYNKAKAFDQTDARSCSTPPAGSTRSSAT
jgi:iron complex outermembrane receptor protein